MTVLSTVLSWSREYTTQPVASLSSVQEDWFLSLYREDVHKLILWTFLRNTLFRFESWFNSGNIINSQQDRADSWQVSISVCSYCLLTKRQQGNKEATTLWKHEKLILFRFAHHILLRSIEKLLLSTVLNIRNRYYVSLGIGNTRTAVSLNNCRQN
jgi:hypothetical protein